jgi:hypothetical protein
MAKLTLKARICEYRRKAEGCRRLASDNKSSDLAGRLLAYSVILEQVARELEEQADQSSCQAANVVAHQAG